MKGTEKQIAYAKDLLTKVEENKKELYKTATAAFKNGFLKEELYEFLLDFITSQTILSKEEQEDAKFIIDKFKYSAKDAFSTDYFIRIYTDATNLPFEELMDKFFLYCKHFLPEVYECGMDSEEFEDAMEPFDKGEDYFFERMVIRIAYQLLEYIQRRESVLASIELDKYSDDCPFIVVDGELVKK